MAKTETAEEKLLAHPDRAADSLSWSAVATALELDAGARCDFQSKIHFGPKTVFFGKPEHNPQGFNGTVSHIPPVLQLEIFGQVSTATPSSDLERAIYTDIFSNFFSRNYGYDFISGYGVEVSISLQPQSPDIKKSMHGRKKKEGYGDSTISYGYASAQTSSYLSVAHALVKAVARAIDAERIVIPGSLADGKVQATVEFSENGAARAKQLIIASQHREGINVPWFKKQITEIARQAAARVLRPDGSPWRLVDDKTVIRVNNGSVFSIGGPIADSGVSGRMDEIHLSGTTRLYGAGLLVGRDCTKTDFSFSAVARKIALHLVAGGFAEDATVKLSCGIGKADTLEAEVTAQGSLYSDEQLSQAALSSFDLSPSGLAKELQITSKTYRVLAQEGFVGVKEHAWERVEKKKLEILRNNLPRLERTKNLPHQKVQPR